jgi:hypothetical protein
VSAPGTGAATVGWAVALADVVDAVVGICSDCVDLEGAGCMP